LQGSAIVFFPARHIFIRIISDPNFPNSAF
jgi:hypothetical protein